MRALESLSIRSLARTATPEQVAFAEKFNQKSSLSRPRKKHNTAIFQYPDRNKKSKSIRFRACRERTCSFVHRPREVTDAAGEAGQATAVSVT
jgi:polynucleotide 5'-kinase involved in rRNA processing